MITVIDEKQLPNRDVRLLVLNDKPPIYLDKIMVGTKIFSTVPIYDLSNAIAVICDNDSPTLIGKTLEIYDGRF